MNEGLLDPKIAAWILDSEQNKDKSLEQLYKEYSCNAVVPYDYTVSLESFSQTFLKVHYSLCLMTKLNELLNQNLKELEIFKEIEMPLVPILAKMEYYGIGFVKDRYKYYEALIRRKLDILEKEAHKLAGKKFRLTNATDVYHVLFVELKIPYPEESTILHSTGKLRRAYYSTKEEVLQSIAHLHPLPNIILEHRKLSHTINNYIDVLPKFAFYDPIVTKMERIHSVCQQTVVPTGRLSFTSPNLQAITHKFQFQFEAPSNRTRNDSNDRSSLGDCSMLSIQKECILVPSSNDTVVTVNIRDSFVSQQDYLLLSADYAQLELRLMAHFSKDKKLRKNFSSNGDIFTLVAAHWLHKSTKEVTENERHRTKRLCYGILYGMGATSLANELEISKAEAKQVIESFKAHFSGIRDFLAHTIESCRSFGYVETLFGRRRYLPKIYSTNKKERSAAERQRQ